MNANALVCTLTTPTTAAIIIVIIALLRVLSCWRNFEAFSSPYKAPTRARGGGVCCRGCCGGGGGVVAVVADAAVLLQQVAAEFLGNCVEPRPDHSGGNVRRATY